jgi:hypothetical protein
MKITLSQLCLALGAGMILTHGWALLRAKPAAEWLRQFHRNYGLGVILMLLGTAWFEWNLYQEQLQDIAAYKNLMLIGFGAVGLGCCLFVRDFLSVRGLTVFLLMLAWLMCEKARWQDSNFRWAVAGWAYVWVLGGLWLSVSPWRLRDWLAWVTATEGRLKLAAAGGVVWGLFIGGLGLTVFK